MKCLVRFLLLALGSLCALLAGPSQAAVINWTNASGGSWNTAIHWSPNQVPGGADSALITNGGTYTVTLGSSLAVANLVLGAAGGAGTQTLAWSGGTLSGCNLAIATSGVLDFNGSTAKSLLHSTVNNAGTIAWTGAGPLTAVVTGAGQSVLITNLAGGLIDLQSDAALAYSDPGYGLAYRFHNAGTLRKSAGLGTNSFCSQCSVINAGTIEMQQGALQFPNGFTNSGSFNLAINSVIHLDGGTFWFGAASLKTGPGQLLVDGGDVVLNGTVPGLSWTGGRLVGSTLTVATNAAVSISGAGAKSLVHSTINNAGTITWTGTGQLVAVMTGAGQSVLITNLAGGLFDLQSDAALAYSDPGYGFIAYRFHNAGTLRKSAGTGTNSFPSQCALINTGSVLIQQGSILFPGCQNNGSLSVLEGSLALLPLGLVNNGTLDLAANAFAYLTGGACSFGTNAQLTGSGHWVIPSGDVTLTGTIPSLTWAGGRLVVSSFTVGTNAVLSISGAASKNLVHSTINNAGTITWTGAGPLTAEVTGSAQSVLITNLAGGLFDLQSDSALAYSDVGYGLNYRFHNAGTLRKSAGTGTNSFPSLCSFINAGTIEMQQGALQFPNGFTSSGSFQLAGSSVIHLDGGTFTFGAASLKTGPGQLLVDGGDVVLNGTLPGLSWTGGRLVVSSFLVATNAVLGISGAAPKSLLHSTINNAGTITWTGAGPLLATVTGSGQSVLITNLAGGLFDLQSDSALAYSDPGYGLNYRFHNAGTLRKSAGTGTNSFPSQCAFINTGSVSIQQGAILFPGCQNDGSMSVLEGSSGLFPLGLVNNGTLDLAANAFAFLTGGACSFGTNAQLTGSGHWVIPSGDVTLTGTIPSLTWAGGRLVVSSFTVGTNAVLSISGAAAKSLLHSTINNAGTITWTGAGPLIAVVTGGGQSVLITNLAGALFDLQSDSALAYSDPGYGLNYRFHNAGTLRKSAGTGTSTFPSQCAFINAGTADLRSGALRFNAAFTQTASGTLGLHDLNPAAGPPRLVAASTANFAGTLDLGVRPGTATRGQSFVAMTFGTRVGTFTQTNGLILGGGLWLRPTFNAQNLTLTVQGPPQILVAQATTGGFQLMWQGEPGLTYSVFGSTNLVNWQLLLSTNTPDGLFQFVDPEFPARAHRFYGTTVQ